MGVEVEMKFPLADPAGLASRLRQLGAIAMGKTHQQDVYFSAPHRDFATTDEALRLRSEGAAHYLTYKGPKLDAVTKTRVELETPLSAEAVTPMARTLARLGFHRVLTVQKEREAFDLHWQGAAVKIAVDRVSGLEPYVELEITTDEANMDRARQQVQDLATALGLVRSERRSYLEMLIARHPKHTT